MGLLFKHNIGTYGFARRKEELRPKASLRPGEDVTAAVTGSKHVPLTEEFCLDFLGALCDAKPRKGRAKGAAVSFLRSFTNVERLSRDLESKFAKEAAPFKVFTDRETVRCFELVERYGRATLFRGGTAAWVHGYWTKVLDGSCLMAASKAKFKKPPSRAGVYPMTVGEMGEWEEDLRKKNE